MAGALLTLNERRLVTASHVLLPFPWVSTAGGLDLQTAPDQRETGKLREAVFSQTKGRSEDLVISSSRLSADGQWPCRPTI